MVVSDVLATDTACQLGGPAQAAGHPGGRRATLAEALDALPELVVSAGVPPGRQAVSKVDGYAGLSPPPALGEHG